MSSTNAIATIAQSIGSLGGLLGPLLNTHSSGSTQISQLLVEANSAAASGDWDEVKTIAHTILAVPGASQAVLENARNIAKAAANAIATTQSSSAAGLPPAQAAAVTMSTQQLVMSEVSTLNAQLASENSGIWNHLWHAHNLITTGTSTSA
jgi:hypothetical protein